MQNHPYRKEMKGDPQAERLECLKVSVTNLLKMLNVKDNHAINNPQSGKHINFGTRDTTDVEDKENRADTQFSAYFRKQKPVVCSGKKTVVPLQDISKMDVNVSNDQSSLLIEKYLKGDKAKEYKEIWGDIYENIHPSEEGTLQQKLFKEDPEPVKQAFHQTLSYPAKPSHNVETEQEDDSDTAILLPIKQQPPRFAKQTRPSQSARSSLLREPRKLTGNRSSLQKTKPQPRRKESNLVVKQQVPLRPPVEQETTQFVPSMAYAPSSLSSSFACAIESIYARLRISKFAATSAVPAANTHRLSECKRHDNERLTNRYSKQLRLRSDVLQKVNSSYMASQVW